MFTVLSAILVGWEAKNQGRKPDIFVVPDIRVWDGLGFPAPYIKPFTLYKGSTLKARMRCGLWSRAVRTWDVFVVSYK